METLDKIFGLKGKVALVTGAGSGLGAAFAEAMAEAGADVACADIREDRLEKTAEKIRKLGRKALTVTTDVSREDEVINMVARTVAGLGTIDVLFNNAGISGPSAKVGDHSLKDWEEVMAINLTGVFLCAREAVKIMVKNGRGKIINIASVWGFVGSSLAAPFPAYNATKGAVINLTREMALEYAESGIQVNCIAPGFFRTELGGGIASDPAFNEMAIKIIPNRKVGDADDLKGAAIFLASAASDLMIGHTLVIDGGYLAQ